MEIEFLQKKLLESVELLTELTEAVKEINTELHELRMKVYQLETNKKMESYFKGEE